MTSILGNLQRHGLAVVSEALAVHDLEARARQLFAMADGGIFAPTLSPEARENLDNGTMCFDFLLGQQLGNILVLMAIQRLLDSPRATILRELFGPDLCFPLRFCALRRQTPGDASPRLPFHQDVAFSGLTCPTVNNWIALTASGGTAPGLQLASSKLDVNLVESQRAKAPQDSSFVASEIDADFVEETYGAHLVAPVLEPGQSIMFDQFTIHRTHVTPGMTEARLSLELRVGDFHRIPVNFFGPKLIVSTGLGRRVLHICNQLLEL